MADPHEAIDVGARDTSSYDGLSFQNHMIAGAVAGIGEHVAMFPVDTIKTRMQALAHPGQQLTVFSRAFRAVFKREGILGLYRGTTAMALGAGPSHALYFATYEHAKHVYGGNEGGHRPFAAAAAGATATVVNDGCMTPWDVMKQRMQVAHSPYRSVLQCALETWRAEGIRAFYKSYWTTLVMNIPYTALHFSVYESAKIIVTSSDRSSSSSKNGEIGEIIDEEEEVEEGLKDQLIAGGLAGGIAAAATTPFDVVKTRLQLEGIGSATRYNTTAVIPVLKRIAIEEGTGALWRGWQPRVLFHTPAAAICWGIYESAKKLLT